jgi:hypothetical protein
VHDHDRTRSDRERASSAEPNIVKVKWPTLEEATAAFEEYALAVGKVAYAWNYLHERLGELFVVVSAAEQAIALAIWYSTKSERGQRDMLRRRSRESRPLGEAA